MRARDSAVERTSGSRPVRLSPQGYSALRSLAAEAGRPMVQCLDELVREAYERRLWQRYAEASRLAEASPKARAVRDAEDAIWSAADADGLDPAEEIAWNESLEDAASW